MNPPTVSSMVTSTCFHSGPSAVSSVTQTTSWCQIPDGCPQKKGSMTVGAYRVESSHALSTIAAVRMRSPYTLNWYRRRARMRLAERSDVGARACGAPVSGVTTSSRAAALLPLIAHQDLILQVVPDLAIDLAELRLHANLRHIARPR